MQDVAGRVKALGTERDDAERERDELLSGLPNLADEAAPDQDTVLREVGEARTIAGARDHLELAGDRIDMERGARLSGSRFAYLRGDLVLLEFALVQWALTKLRGHGFEPVIPPVLVREEALHGTGFLPDTEQQIYHLPEDDLYLVGTSEVALASLHADEILDGAALPVRYAGFSSCFRREAGRPRAATTRGIFRVHQFDKVEMSPFVARRLARRARAICSRSRRRSIKARDPSRVVDIAVDDLGASAARKFDCEAGCRRERYRELTSTSNTPTSRPAAEDPHARRRQARGPPHAQRHAVPGAPLRAAENGQREDGSVALPEALRPVRGAGRAAAPA
jgi:seryl-tRNA synthetase